MNDKEKERIEKCVVQIECIHKLNDKDVEFGTGFFIKKNTVVTASHVIDKYYTNPLDYFINVIPINADIDKDIKVKGVMESKRNNFIAILELEENVEIINPLKFTLGYTIKRDDEYFTFGHPRGKRIVGYQVQNKIATPINETQSRKANWDLNLSGERLEDFEGFSGSPVVIDNMLIGVVQTESAASGKTISIGMSSVDKVKGYIPDEYFKKYICKKNFKNIGEFFEEWNDTLNSKIGGDLLTSGREKSVQSVRNWIIGKERILNISADSKDEAILFFISVVSALEGDIRNDILQNSFLIETIDEWNKLMTLESTSIFIPRFKETSNMNKPQNCRIVVPYTNDDVTIQDEVVQLNKQSPKKFVSGLVKLGIDSEKAFELSNDTNRSLLALRRSLSTSPWIKKPKWMEQQNLRVLLPVLFVGAFDENEEEDINIMSKLAECSYKEYKEKIIEWANFEDSPIERIGTIYKMINIQDMWDYLWNYISKDDTDKFKECALKVLQAENPKFELANDKWIMASIIGKKIPYSQSLINGITKSLIMLALRNDRKNNFNFSTQYFVDNIFKKVYENCITWEKWFSIADRFDIFVEASPNESLNILEKQLENDKSSFWEIFKRNGDALFDPNYYTNILWGLEKLIYDEDYAFRVCFILEKLSEKDFKYRMENKPINSLYNILVPIHPKYTLNKEDVKELLGVMIKRSPNTGWKLLMMLIPEHNKIYGNIVKPKWRVYENKDEKLEISNIEYEYRKENISKSLIDNMQTNINRWIDILEHISSIDKESIDLFSENIELYYKNLDDKSLYLFKGKLREVISKNREFANSWWALDEIYSNRLEKLLDLITSDDLIEKYSYLFKQHVNLLNPIIYLKENKSSWEENEKMIQLEREKALIEIYDQCNIEGLFQVLVISDDIWSLGAILAIKIFNYELRWDIILNLVELKKGYILGHYLAHINNKKGLVELRKLIRENKNNLNDEEINIILQSCPFNNDNWNFINELDTKTIRVYWSNLRISTLMDQTSEDSERICNNLLLYNRPYTVIQLLAYDNFFHVSIAIKALEMAIDVNFNSESSGVGLSRVTYEIAELFKRIYNVLNIDEAKLFKLEINYFAIIKKQCEPKILMKELKKSPDLFVEVLSNVYKKRDNQTQEVSEKEKSIAKLSYDILDIFKQLPGFEENRIDKEHFNEWIVEVRKKCNEQDIVEAGEEYIARLLAYAPTGDDLIWPHEVVREFIEQNCNDDIIERIARSKISSRGVYDCSGGMEERKISNQYNQDARRMKIQCPKCFKLLKKLAEYYESDAKYEEENDM